MLQRNWFRQSRFANQFFSEVEYYLLLIKGLVAALGSLLQPLSK